MATRDETRTINGRTYYAVQLPPDKALVLQLRLIKILGGAFGQLAPNLVGSDKANNSVRGAALAGAVGALFANATELEVFGLIREFVTSAKVDGRRIDDINKEFQGEYLADIYKVFFWLVGLNYASFFGEGGLDGLLTKFQTMFSAEMASQNASPQASTPGSGDQSPTAAAS